MPKQNGRAPSGSTPKTSNTNAVTNIVGQAPALVNIDDNTPIWMLTVGQFRALTQSSTAPSDDVPMTAPQIARLRAGVTDGWLRGHVTAMGRGARGRRMYRLCDVDAALAESPVQPRTKKCKPEPGQDPFDALIASGSVVRGQQ